MAQVTKSSCNRLFFPFARSCTASHGEATSKSPIQIRQVSSGFARGGCQEKSSAKDLRKEPISGCIWGWWLISGSTQAIATGMLVSWCIKERAKEFERIAPKKNLIVVQFPPLPAKRSQLCIREQSRLWIREFNAVTWPMTEFCTATWSCEGRMTNSEQRSLN